METYILLADVIRHTIYQVLHIGNFVQFVLIVLDPGINYNLQSVGIKFKNNRI
jgi:hypothetical protein